MADPAAPNATYSWLIFALLTVITWGVYGVFLHKGQTYMADPVNGRYKAFLFVGIAYFLTAVLAPVAVLILNKATWSFPQAGLWWSLIAGIVGAIGAFCVLLAFGSRGSPAAVMSIIFAGAPIVNAVVAITIERNWANIRPAFLAGVVLAAVGGFMVARYKPAPPKHPAPAVQAGEPTAPHP